MCWGRDLVEIHAEDFYFSGDIVPLHCCMTKLMGVIYTPRVSHQAQKCTHAGIFQQFNDRFSNGMGQSLSLLSAVCDDLKVILVAFYMVDKLIIPI